MNAFTKTLMAAAICCCFSFYSFAQSAEKIHAHLDKDIYLPGETVWFKAYIFESGRPSASTNLYAGWYNKEGKLLKEKRYPVFNGTANGDFEIPGELPDPVYQLRLFTKNILQTDSNLVFIKPVQVYSNDNKTANTASFAKASLEIFPEGGKLVADINNHIALRIIAPGAAGYLAPAALEDNTDKLVDSVYFDPSGISKVQLTPKPSLQYFLKWTDPSGNRQTTPLPPAEMNGATLHTELSGASLYYIVQKNSSIPRLSNVRISISSGKDLLYSAKLNLEKTTQVLNRLPADSLPSGIIDISLSDAEGNLLQKKWVYIKNKTQQPEIVFIEKNNSPKGKNVIDIFIKDTALNLLSVAVVDEIFERGNSSSILDELLLGNPSAGLYKVLNDDKKTDLVVMSSGFKYVTTNATTTPDNYLSLLAKFDERKKTLPEKSMLTVIANDKVNGKQIFSLMPGKEKNFASTGLVVYDSAKLYYQLNTKELSDYISLKEISNCPQPMSIAAAPEIIQYEMKSFPAFNDTAYSNYANNSSGKFNEERTLKEVQVTGKKRNPYQVRMEEMDNRYATNMFRGLTRGDHFNLVDDPMADSYQDIFSYIAGKVAGIIVVRKSAGGWLEAARGAGRGGGQMMVFIDEVEATWDMAGQLPLSRLAYIKVINGIVLGASFRSTTGAVFIYTRKGNDIKNNTPPMNNISIKGYDLPKEFLSPDYSDKQALLNKDYRSTLYWNPNIETNKDNQKIRIEFYNNDISRKQVLVLKGFTEDGELIEIRKPIE